jgi:hypothetical protein
MPHFYSLSDFVIECKVEDLRAKYYTGMEVSTFHQLVAADPTSITRNGETKKMGTYSKWLLKLFQDGKLLLEDLYKATEYLSMFDKLKAQKVITRVEADINRYGSLPDLFKQLKQIGGTGETGKDESYLLNDRYYINQGEAEVFHEDKDYLIVIPRALKASQFYAHNTEWCTKYPDNFKEYSEQGDLYIIIDKRMLNTNDELRRMQFHFQCGQFMDINDDSLPQPVKTVFLTVFQRVKESWKLCYDEVDEYHEGRFPVKLNMKWGVTDSDGNEVVSPKYDFVGSYHEGRVRVVLNGKYGFVDLDGHMVVPFKYDYVWDYMDGMARVKLNEKWGFVGLNGKVVVPLIYNHAEDFSEGRARVKLNSKYGFIDLEGNEVVPLIYDGMYNFKEGRASVQRKEKYGVVDLNGNEVVPLKYNWVYNFSEGRAIVGLNGRWGGIDLDGNEVVPLLYDCVYHFSEGRASVELNDKWGFIDLNGNEVVPPIYDSTGNFSEGRARVRLNGKRGYIDLDGNETWD